MSVVSGTLMKHWEGLGLMLGSPRSSEEIANFEGAQGVTLPADFKDYFQHVNGLVDIGWSGVDGNGFAFWPLGGLKSAHLYDPECQIAKSLGSSHYVFADYRERSWAYAIDLGSSSSTRGQIVHVGTLEPKIVAPSLSDFVALYLGDSAALYPNTV